jgi:hypothetical protein
METRNYLFLILIPFFYITCVKNNSESCHYTIPFINNSLSDIYVDHHYDADAIEHYSPSAYTSNQHDHKVFAQNVNEYAMFSTRCKEYYFTAGVQFTNGTQGLLDTLLIYVFDAEAIEKPSAEYKILSRYDLSLKDLQQLGWRLTYPPTEAMKHMKMYPPYGTYK